MARFAHVHLAIVLIRKVINIASFNQSSGVVQIAVDVSTSSDCMSYEATPTYSSAQVYLTISAIDLCASASMHMLAFLLLLG